MTTLELLQLVDLGDCHCRTAEEMFDVGLYRQCQELVEMGYLRQLPAREGTRWAERFVLTARGSTALGTFDWDGPMPRVERRPAGRVTVQAATITTFARL